MKVVYCDNHILVVEKPAGLPTQGEEGEKSLQTEAQAWVKQKYQKKGNVFLHPVHRLDAPVSGLVLFARTSKALSRLNEMMREHKIEKTYTALVEGDLEEKQGTLRHKLLHGEHRALISSKGKEAILDYKVIKKIKNNTLVEIHLHTGRYHQIRAQFSAIGHPIVGDTKYGAKTSGSLQLCSAALSFTHPVTGASCEFRL